MSKTALLIHGAFGGPWTMAPFAAPLTQRGWDCKLPTLRHHGRQPGDAEALVGLGIEDYCADLAELIGTLEAPPVLIGHSMGGVIAQKLAAQGLASAVVLLNSSVLHGILPTNQAERSVGTTLMAAGAFWETSLGLDLPTLEELALNTLDSATRQAIFERLGPESGRALFQLFFWMFDPERTTAVEPARVTCPVLVVSGAEDRGVSSAVARQIAARYGERASYREVPDACHYLMFDRAGPAVAAQAADWLEEVLP
ncbi:MAG: alpha/beta hydrolase [Rhodospirillales bacterium]